MITALLVLSFLVFFHELGHFLVARYFGVHVEVFSIGFGKKIFTKHYKGTDYCLSIIPLGGYVQMKGQDDSDPTKVSLDSDSYTTKTPLQKIAILFAGPFANFLLAFFLYIIIAHLGVPKLTTHIGKIIENSPAVNAGLQVNDEILSINSIDVKSWDEIKPIIAKSDGMVEILTKRGEETILLNLLPQVMASKNIFGEDIQEKLIGISPLGTTTTITLGFAGSIKYAYDETLRSASLILQSLQKLVVGVLSPKEMGGPIAIVQITSSAADAGIVALLFLTALISVNLGVINLFPIPALDGGHIMFNIYELIRKKPPSEAVFTKLTYAGWAFLLSLMAFTVINDILRR